MSNYVKGNQHIQNYVQGIGFGLDLRIRVKMLINLL